MIYKLQLYFENGLQRSLELKESNYYAFLREVGNPVNVFWKVKEPDHALGVDLTKVIYFEAFAE